MPSTVFVVDDEKNIRRTVRMVLEGEGFTVEEASSGEEALARLRDIGADVMFLDVQLPGMSGLDAIERISKLKSPEPLPTPTDAEQAGALLRPLSLAFVDGDVDDRCRDDAAASVVCHATRSSYDDHEEGRPDVEK